MKRWCTCMPCIHVKNKHCKRHEFATWQYAFLLTKITFYNLLRHALNQNFCFEWGGDLLLKAFSFFFTFPWSPFLIFLLEWLISYWPSHSKIAGKASIMISNSFHGVDECSWRKLNFWTFSNLFPAPLTQSLWSGYHWKPLEISLSPERTWV